MSAQSAAGPVPSDEPSPRLRPQSLMLTYLGNYVLGRDIAVFSGSFIDTFARLGVGEHAVRSTLTRMVGRGLLARHREGRRMHFGLTPRSEGILHDGEDRVWRRGVLNTDWDGNELLLSDVLGTEGDMVYKCIEESVEKQLLSCALDHLSPREQRIMQLRFGLSGGQEKTQKEVADILGISQSYISRLEKRILSRLHVELTRISS